MSASIPPRPSLFVEHLINFLIPFFIVIIPDMDAARDEILQTLAAYGARTRSEMLNAAQITAFGFSALDVLGDAKQTGMSPSMGLRFHGCANSLNRSCQQNEKSLARRLACDLPSAAEPAAEAVTEPLNDLAEPQVQEAIQQAQAAIDTHRNRRSATNRPAPARQAMPATQQERNKQLWGSAMMDALAEMGMPVRPAATP